MNELALANTNDPQPTHQRADARRSAHMDRGPVGTVSKMGTSPQGLRPTAEAKKIAPRRRKERDKKDYAIDAVLRAFKVLEALEGRGFEPIKIMRVQQRTGFTYNFCLRALRTLELAGYAKETLDGWILGAKIQNFATRHQGATLLEAGSRSTVCGSENP